MASKAISVGSSPVFPAPRKGGDTDSARRKSRCVERKERRGYELS
jgi:hypothetical protein